jgi:23S rRNA (cytosine1962-C5)-methyltransferase
VDRVARGVALLVSRVLPCLLYEDEHLLAVNKPAGLNTHAPSPFAGEGLYDWLRHREPRWARLAIVQRLDKETSGVIVFAKTPLANRSLTDQFTRHTARKRYVFLTDREMRGADAFTVESIVARQGSKYVSHHTAAEGQSAITHFKLLSAAEGVSRIEARPVTGRTHQIRVHAADRGLPILGDQLYGGSPAKRVFLHAEELTLSHPETQAEIVFRAAADFDRPPWVALRAALIDPRTTDAYRLIHGEADGYPGWYVERLGAFLLSQAEYPLTNQLEEDLKAWLGSFSLRGAYHKRLNRYVGKSPGVESCAQRVRGEAAPDEFVIQENGLSFALRFGEGYSVGLFLDQRDNRRRLLVNHVAADFPVWPAGLSGISVLNTFAYTCGFSVCAAKGGARVTSLDLSRKYLDWGRRNFVLNGLDAAPHEFLAGDVFDWLRRWLKKDRRFEIILLDPPAFSQSKVSGTFQAEQDFGRLVGAAVGLLQPGGILFASCNARKLAPERFLAMITEAIQAAGRKIRQQHYVPQPPDFPIHRAEPAYLKTVWLRVE